MADAPSPIGDNLKSTEPTMTAEELEALLAVKYAANLERAAELLAKGEPFTTIENDAQESEATEFLVKLNACVSTADMARDSEKRPWDNLAGAAHAFFKGRILDPLAAEAKTSKPGLKARINAGMRDYKLKVMEAERRKREEAARLQREAEAKAAREAAEQRRIADEAAAKAARARNAETKAKAEADAKAAAEKAREAADKAAAASNDRAAAEDHAAAPAADLTRARGTRGGVSSLREAPVVREFKRDDFNLATMAALFPHLKDEHIESALRGYITANKDAVLKAIKDGHEESLIAGVAFKMGYASQSRA